MALLYLVTVISIAIITLIGITRTRSKHDYKIRPKVARTNYFKYSFFHGYINDWNSLPSEVMSSPSLQSFKVSLIKYLRS